MALVEVPAESQNPAAPRYHPTADMQSLLSLINDLMPTDKPAVRAVIAREASALADRIVGSWPAP